jgi:leader peptidase (prepilin peptidase)/N-methyltransferase
MVELSAFVIGVVLGSFLNVCIWRLPARQSIVSPPSHCPKCEAGIRVYDNVPLLSFALLRGRCRACRQPISWRYPVVEVLTGLTLVALVRHFGLGPLLPVYAGFMAALIVVTFIDLDHQIIPDAITLPGIVIGLFCAAIGLGPSLAASVVGILLGGGFLYAVAAGYEMLTGREGMGGGDIKLLAMIGAFLGWAGVLTTLLLSSFSGAAVGGLLIVFKRADGQSPIPFGPFLAAGATCALFTGNRLIDWYIQRVLLT